MVPTATVPLPALEGRWSLHNGPGRILPASESSRRRLRLVVIDDDRDHADSLATVLHLFGHEADAAYSGPEALEVTLALCPDVVICDLAMPGMDGYTVVETLRDDPGLSATTFIAASGYGADGDCARALQAGFHLHLLKPLDLERLHELLAETARRVTSAPPYARRRGRA